MQSDDASLLCVDLNYKQIQDIAPKHIKISKSEKIYLLIVHPDIISYNFVVLAKLSKFMSKLQKVRMD